MKVEIFDAGYFPSGGSFGFDSKGLDNVSLGMTGLKRMEDHISPVVPGTYNIKFHFHTGVSQAAKLTFFKHNQVSCRISNIQVDLADHWDVRIQPLVFEPKPDYEAGDIIKLTNTNKAPNGDDVTVTVKINKEIDTISEVAQYENKSPGTETYPDGVNEFTSANGDSMYAPEDWISGINVSNTDTCSDSDFKSGSGDQMQMDYLETTNQQTLGVPFDGGVELNDGTDATSADWNSNLQMVVNNDFSEANPDNPIRPLAWFVSDSYLDTGTTDTPSWIWHDGYDPGNMGVEIYNGSNRKRGWTNFYPTCNT